MANADFNKIISNLTEVEAKSLLAQIFSKVGRVDGIKYKATDCYSEIEGIFRDRVGGSMIFGKDSRK